MTVVSLRPDPVGPKIYYVSALGYGLCAHRYRDCGRLWRSRVSEILATREHDESDLVIATGGAIWPLCRKCEDRHEREEGTRP